MTSAPASISATPATLNFAYVTGDPIPSASLTAVFILSSNGAALPATLAVGSAPWLTVNPTGNISLVGLLNTITVTVDPTGLVPKVYTGSITVTAAGSANKSISVPVTLTVDAAPPQTFSTWPAGVIEGSGTSIVTVGGNNFFSNSTAAVSGFTPAATITVNDGVSDASSTFLIPVYQPTATELRLSVASPLPSGAKGAAYAQTLTAAGGTSPYQYSVIGGFPPPGLGITGAAITGTPTAAGTYIFTIQVTDSTVPPIQAYSQVQMTIDPAGAAALRITVAAAPMPEGIVGTVYAPVTLTAAGGSGGPYTWSAVGLPTGLSLSAAGVLDGTPSTDGAGGALGVSVVSDSAMLATIPSADLGVAGVLRIQVTTPAPGGGKSNEADASRSMVRNRRSPLL